MRRDFNTSMILVYSKSNHIISKLKLEIVTDDVINCTCNKGYVKHDVYKTRINIFLQFKIHPLHFQQACRWTPLGNSGHNFFQSCIQTFQRIVFPSCQSNSSEAISTSSPPNSTVILTPAGLCLCYGCISSGTSKPRLPYNTPLRKPLDVP